jgi:hypothetical protein
MRKAFWVAIGGLAMVAASGTWSQATPTSPVKVADIEVYTAKPMDVYTAKPIDIETARPIERDRRGLDPVPGRRGADESVVGTWAIYIPGTAWTSEVDNGATITRTTHVGLGGPLGVLTISSHGTYRWRKEGATVASGRLVQVVPRRGAVVGVTYWALTDGRYRYYLSRDRNGPEITLCNVATDLYAASGKRMR